LKDEVLLVLPAAFSMRDCTAVNMANFLRSSFLLARKSGSELTFMVLRMVRFIVSQNRLSAMPIKIFQFLLRPDIRMDRVLHI
jgi:hypothetical protein